MSSFLAWNGYKSVSKSSRLGRRTLVNAGDPWGCLGPAAPTISTNQFQTAPSTAFGNFIVVERHGARCSLFTAAGRGGTVPAAPRFGAGAALLPSGTALGTAWARRKRAGRDHRRRL